MAKKMSPGLLDFWQRTSIKIGSQGVKGGTYYLRYDLNNTFAIRDKIYTVVEKHKVTAQGREVTTMTREVKFKPNGEVALGKLYIDKYNPVVTRRFNIGGNVKGRLEVGFESLMAHYQHGGVSRNIIESLRTKWYSMSDSQKAQVFNLYRQETTDAQYGSSSISSRGMGLGGDAMEYVDMLDRSLDRAMSGD